MDTYFIGCRWRDRKEDADACTNRIVRCLKGLAACDAEFEPVYVVPRSHTLPYRIPVDFETLKPLVEEGRNREDVPPRRIIEKLGYSVSFVSGADYRKRQEQWSLRIMCGAYPQVPAMANHCNLSLPQKGEALKTLLLHSKTACLVRAMIDAWDPDWATVEGSDFSDYVRESAGVPKRSPKGIFPGWMTYFATRFGKIPEDLPVHSRIELEQGTLLILTDDPITRERPEHVATAEAVLRAFQQSGLISTDGAVGSG
jgi:hypothetical protein